MARVKQIETGEFIISTDPKEFNYCFTFSTSNFTVLKLYRIKIPQAPRGYHFKIEQEWKEAGRAKKEVIAFEDFRAKYLKDNAPIFKEAGAVLTLTLGYVHNNEFFPITKRKKEMRRLCKFRAAFNYELYQTNCM
jgi:hypothetical protein